ncbi:Origin recognition complex subunit 3 [Hypoxylon texense]
MPPRAIRVDNFICRSCLSSLRKQTPTAQWALRYSSQAAQPVSSETSSHRSREQEIERQKTLETLGLLKGSKHTGVSVNYFEQGKGGRLRRLRDEDEFGQSLNDPDGQTELRMKELEQELEQATQFTKIVEKIWGKQGAEKLRQRVASQEDEALPKSSLLLPEEDWTAQDRTRIVQLNNMIRTIGRKAHSGVLPSKRINSLWKYYYAARVALSKKWESVHADIWDLLWQILAADHPNNPNRMSHTHVLAKDMQSAGVALRDDQQLLAIEATFISGFQEDAITAHKKLVTTLGARPDTFVEFWQLGLRMYCLTGDIVRAERVANTLLESPYEKDPRFLLPFIRMCAEKPATVEKGFELYQRLRSALGDTITIEDYDQVISYFLTSNETEYAFYVFVEMMTSNTVDLRGTHRVPPSVASPFFYGKWLKRLIGAGDLEGAHNVLLHMKSRGVMPHAIVVNGLIGAWLRSGTADNIKNAEDIAWAMINARMQFLNIRKDMKNLATYVRLRQYGEGWPRANLETFSLLAENYKDRGIHSKMEELWRAFRDAEIPPNSFMLNQLLFSYLQDGQGKHVAALTRDLTNQYQVEPDSWTFMVLWQALAINRLVQIPAGQTGEEISRTRSLFAEMVRSAHILATSGIDVQLARFVLHSFRKLDDKFGLLLAYRALRQIFKFEPPDSVVFELYVGSMDLERTAKGKGGLRLMHAGKQIEDYLKRRHEELIAAGQLDAGDDLPDDVKREELGNFVELFLQNQVELLGDENMEQTLEQAAIEMGLNDEVPSFDDV